MKNVYLSALILFIYSFQTQATIWRINNAPNSTPNFSTIQAAIDSDLVLAGDTLIIEGSSEEYGSFDVDKTLVIIGSGYFLNENPKTSVEGATVIIQGNADFQPGSEGSILSGVLFGGDFTSNHPSINADNIIINKCYLRRGIDIDDRVTGLIVTQNYFADNDINFSFTNSAMQGTVFKNNIVAVDFLVNTTLDDPRTFAAVENNLFLGSVNVTTSTYRNNIWLPLQSETIQVIAGIKEYNLNVSVDMGSSNNNQVISGLSDLYTGEGSTDGKWQIKEDSNYKNAGKDGTDPGPFGGSNPYVLSGVPAIPVIYEISTTGFGSQDEGLPVTIKVRSN